MTYFYYSPKQAALYRNINQSGGRYSSTNKPSFKKVNYVLDGDKMIAFTEQGLVPPDQMKGWDDRQLVFQSENPKTINSQELW